MHVTCPGFSISSVRQDIAGRNFYREAMEILIGAGLPFMVGGAYALRVYTGVVRDTKDFDLMVRREDVDRMLELFKESGFVAGNAFSHWLAKVHHGEEFIDIIYSSGNGLCPVDDTWFPHAREVSLMGLSVKVCPPEELIWQKAYVMERERFDGADIAHLIRSCGVQIDWPRLVARFGDDWRVLLSHLVLFGFIYPSKSPLVPPGVVHELIARLASETDIPLSDEKICNGTFLSRAQYLPDIGRWGFLDARLQDRCAMSPKEITDWTNGISENAIVG